MEYVPDIKGMLRCVLDIAGELKKTQWSASASGEAIILSKFYISREII